MSKIAVLKKLPKFGSKRQTFEWFKVGHEFDNAVVHESGFLVVTQEYCPGNGGRDRWRNTKYTTPTEKELADVPKAPLWYRVRMFFRGLFRRDAKVPKATVHKDGES